MPPTFLFVAIMLMVALHFLWPVRRLPNTPAKLLGLIPMLVGLVMNVWASNVFNRVGTAIEPFRQSDQLVTNGLYRFTRNPMYLGFVLVLVGVAVMLGSLTPLLVIPPFIALTTIRFIHPEESALEERFGTAYLEYKRRVRRWV
jgi:protein-S-isoprenylcysteine O-methyltransferase Ste14